MVVCSVRFGGAKTQATLKTLGEALHTHPGPKKRQRWPVFARKLFRHPCTACVPQRPRRSQWKLMPAIFIRLGLLISPPPHLPPRGT